ncbi:cupin domain-containing protein [Nakamurella endophytica]|uniref:cupin domain-containing protein n=1 Tax=Nakamurella endophytica TaxID=1748367 RepID=UPI003570B6E7
MDQRSGAAGTTGRPRSGAAGGRDTGRTADADPLSRCIDVPAARFAEQLWGRAPHYTPATDPQAFDDLFSTEAVDELVSRRGLRTPFLRMAKDGSVLPERLFTRGGGSGAGITDQVSDDRVLGQLAAGATLVLQALHRTWPPLVRFGSALSAQLGHPVQINSYITPAQNQGFSAHYDTHDVFVLQIAGTKRWVIHPPVLEHPLPDQPWDQRRGDVAAAAAQAPLLDQVLAPADALYLPRGYLHAASAQGELSIHLTVGIHPVTGYRVAQALVQALREDAGIRRSLPVGVDLTDPGTLAGVLRTVADRLADVAARPETRLPAVASALRAELTSATRPQPLSPLATLAAADRLQGSDSVRLRGGLRWELGDGASGPVLRTLDKSIGLPAVMAQALRRLLDGAPHRIDELPGLDADEQLVLGRRLLREGVVVPAPARPGG